ncbi:hypothetical protein J2129_001074 [Methanofollis sp. W23]|uniref:DUF3821 domain-containing protein n=1 Tax=Methanofollis sp. W23 TaxID=2817849 RepID=UPI001AE45AF9|nr:DUF3821 domain-containing protein [Methanofollis sp. W23]MBP2145620.1 hypothetical protein [Methanofollis sp. W23]
MVRNIYSRASLFGILCGLLLLGLVVMSPAAARGDTISQIEPGDTVFVYEEGLNLSALRNETTNNPVTALVRYEDGDVEKGEQNRISVPDDSSVSLIDVDIDEDETGTYYAYSRGDNGRTGDRIMIRYPEVRIEPVLAAPNHADRIEGITIPAGTAIAFKVVGHYVGTEYHAGDEYAMVDLVVTSPSGAEVTYFKGQDLSDIPLTASVIYTDDPGVSGPIVLDRLEEGEYKVQARWSAPQGFADYAEDSNVVTFDSGNRIGVNMTVPTETVTETPSVTETPAPTATTPVPAETVTETTVQTTPVPETTTEAPTTAPTQTPLSLIPALAALSLGILVLARK